MVTTRNKAEEYANRIRNAALVVETAKSATASTKTASTLAVDELKAILADIDTLYWESSGESLSEDEKNEILAQIDEVLGAQSGAMRSIKEGSVKSLFQFSNQVSLFLSSLGVRR